MRALSWLLALAALAVGLALVMLYNEGYVLLVLPPWRVELSLNLFIFLLIAGFLFLYLLLRAVVHTLRLPASVRAFRARRQQEKAETALRDALSQWLSGRYAQSMKSAELAYKAGHAPGLAALLALRSAHALRDGERRQLWQQHAAALDVDILAARLMTEAELALEGRDYTAALKALNTLMATQGRHIAAMRLALRAHRGLGQWTEVLHLLRQLNKHHAFSAEQALPLILGAHRERVRQLQGDGRALVAYWAQIPTDERRGAGLALEMAQSLIASGEFATAQAVIEEGLEENWDSFLIALYADCKGSDVLGRIARAEEWLLQQPNDTKLLLTLGRLCVQQQLWGKAQSYLEASLALRPSVTANIQLATLLEQLGHTDQANRLYRAAALLSHSL